MAAALQGRSRAFGESRKLKVALVCASTAMSMVAAECALRFFRISFAPFHRVDTERAWSLRPGASGWSRREGVFFVRINSDGLRDREHQLKKPAGTRRIVVLGDSFGWGWGVDASESFPSIIENELNRLGRPRGEAVEVINFSVDDYGQAQQYLTLQHHVWKYEPDIVLLALFPGNDIANSTADLNGGPRCPYYRRSGGRLILERSFLRGRQFSAFGLWWDGVAGEVLKRSNLLQTVNGARLAWTYSRKELDAVEASRQAGERNIHNMVFVPPEDDHWREAWSITEELLLAIRNETRSHGAGFHLALVSNDVQVHPDRRVRELFMRRLGVGDLEYPNRRLREFAVRNGIACTDSGPVLLRSAESTGVAVHGLTTSARGFGHWNKVGHRLAGEMIAGDLARALSLRRTASSRAAVRVESIHKE
jgi:hypothetical protein